MSPHFRSNPLANVLIHYTTINYRTIGLRERKQKSVEHNKRHVYRPTVTITLRQWTSKYNNVQYECSHLTRRQTSNL